MSKSKKKNMPDGISSLFQGLQNNEFKLVPNQYIDQLSEIFPPAQRNLLDSSFYGLSADCIFVISNRIDLKDDPYLINSEILVCSYNSETKSASLTGCLLYRGGTWHHNKPTDNVTSNLNYDQIGIMNEILQVSGTELDQNIKNSINDAFSQTRQTFPNVVKRRNR